MVLTGENRSTGRKICHSPPYVPEISSRTDVGFNLGLRGDRPVTNLPRHGTAIFILHNISATIQSLSDSKRTTSLLRRLTGECWWEK